MQRVPDDEPFDVLVGRSIRSIREALPMTQTELAAAVQARGLDLVQQTIVKIEQGTRPLRLREADVIADVFQLSVESLLPAQPYPASVAMFLQSTRDLVDAGETVAAAVRAFETRRQRLLEMLALTVSDGQEDIPLPLRQAAEDAARSVPPSVAPPREIDGG